MGKAILYLCGICFIIAFVIGMFQDYGWAVVLWPGGILTALCVLAVGVSAINQWVNAPQRRALATKEAVGRLEAEQGIPVATEGTCRACGKALVVGAKFCAYCKTPTVRSALICPDCKTRNPEDANWCAECGAALAKDVANAHSDAKS